LFHRLKREHYMNTQDFLDKIAEGLQKKLGRK